MKKGSANTAIAVLGIDSARNKYLLDGVNHRMNLSDRWSGGAGTCARIWLNQPGVQMVSRSGYEAFGAQADLDYFYETNGGRGQQLPHCRVEVAAGTAKGQQG
jgi:hypothetical protein